ncbi:MAG: hypothetical protein ABTD50_02250 [Polyangiaceae bacterium]
MFDSESPPDGRLLDVLCDDGPPAPPEVRARVRARLQAVIPAMRGDSGVGGRGSDSSKGQLEGGREAPPSSFPVARNRVGELLGRSARAAAMFAAGAVAGFALYASYARASGAHPNAFWLRPDRGDVTPVAPGGRVSVTRRLAEADAQRASYIEPAESVVTSVPRRNLGAFRPVQPAPTPSTEVSQFDAERILLDAARAGLIQGDPEIALARIETHRAKYPEGFLAEERDAMRVEALVRAQRYEDARQAAARFRAHRFGSMYMPTVDDAVSSIP